jgi:hypothetical protein
MDSTKITKNVDPEVPVHSCRWVWSKKRTCQSQVES